MKENGWLRLEKIMHRVLKLDPPAPPMFLDEAFDEVAAREEVESPPGQQTEPGNDGPGPSSAGNQL